MRRGRPIIRSLESREVRKEFAYRNKMEFSFGDEYKDGPLSLGLHKREAPTMS